MQKILASGGISSRREAEEYIVTGRVEVDGQVVTELGTRVFPFKQEVCVDGQKLKIHRPLYYAVNKPSGFVCTNRDPQGRPRVLDLIPDSQQRLFTVGRLDRTSEGLLLVTNDGDLAQRLTHPRYGVEKVYRVQVAGELTRDELAQLTQGVHLAEGFAQAKSARIRNKQGESTWLEVTLSEGKNREIRRLLAKIGHKVLHLRRIAVGPLRLGDLALGEIRQLTGEELRQLQSVAAGTPLRVVRQQTRKAFKRRKTQAAAAKAATGAGGPNPHSQPPHKRRQPSRTQPKTIAQQGGQAGSRRTSAPRDEQATVLQGSSAGKPSQRQLPKKSGSPTKASGRKSSHSGGNPTANAAIAGKKPRPAKAAKVRGSARRGAKKGGRSRQAGR